MARLFDPAVFDNTVFDAANKDQEQKHGTTKVD
jgi:hypothetical protein